MSYRLTGLVIGISMILYIGLLMIVSTSFVVGWIRHGARFLRDWISNDPGPSGSVSPLWDRELDG